MNRFISKVLKLEGYLEGNLLKRYPTGAAPANSEFNFRAPMFLSWTDPVASGTRLPQFLAASCSSSALFLRCTCLQAPFWRRRGASGCLLDGLGWYFSIVFLSFPRWRALEGTTPRSYENHSFYSVERTWR